ncbi:MAG: hypothetical protein JNL52_00895 [Flavobacteriales bacterium]|nr:hypothetical protein [Flavobacteriales bacterium]
MRLAVFILALLCAVLGLHGQEMKLPTWMLSAMTRERSAAEDSLLDARIYASFGVEKVKPNTFIGSFSMTVEVRGKEAPMRIMVEHWSDTLKAMVRFIMPKESGSLLYLADLKANTAILATEGKGRKEAVIYDLRDLVLLNGIALQNAEKLVPVRGQRKERIAGRVCTEHTAQWDNEEVRLWLSDVHASPFVDASHWLPFTQGLFALYAAPSMHGEPMPLRWTSDPLSYEVTTLQLGRVTPPSFDLATFSVKDERKRKGAGTASSTPAPKSRAKVPEPAYYQALRERTRNAFQGSVRWQWVYKKYGEVLFKVPEATCYTVVSTPDSLLMMSEHHNMPVSSATLCERSTRRLTEFSRSKTPHPYTYTPYVVDKVPFDAPVPQPTGRTEQQQVALPLPAGTKRVDEGRPSATVTLTAHEYRSVTAEGDTLIAWIVPEIPSPFHDLYAAGNMFYGITTWTAGVLPVDGLPLRIQRTDSKGSSVFSVIELGTGPVSHLLDAFARDTLDTDLGHAIPDRPAIYEEAVRRRENRFTGHVHLVHGKKFHPDSAEARKKSPAIFGGKFHPESVEARSRTDLDWYATEDRILLVEKSQWKRRAWTIDRRTHEVVEYVLKGDEVIQRPPMLGRTHPPDYRARDTLLTMGRDTTMLGLPCAVYRDPHSGARIVVTTDIPSPWQDLYGFDPRYLRLAGIDTPWLQPVEGLVLHISYPASMWISEVLEVDRSPVDKRVFTITKDTWRP